MRLDDGTIFLDNASTTRIFDEVATASEDMEKRLFFNPSAMYGQAIRVREAVDKARGVIAENLCCDRREVVFTSGATEANNWVFNSGIKNKKGSVVISAGEHASVFDCANILKGRGMDVRIVGLTGDGRVDFSALERALDSSVALVSIIHCSNETGAINDIASASALIKSRCPSAYIHSDGVQAFCKIPTDVRRLGVDFYTISAHKIGGRKGCGALYINRKNNIAPLIVGGGQESGLRSGTENTPAIVGFGHAVAAFKKRCNNNEMVSIFNYLRSELECDGWVYNGANCQKSNDKDTWDYKAGAFSGYILSLSYPGIKAEVLQHMLEGQGVLIGLGSACAAKTSVNRVLTAMGRDKKYTEGSIRLSFSIDTTMDDAKIAREKIRIVLNNLKEKMRIV